MHHSIFAFCFVFVCRLLCVCVVLHVYVSVPYDRKGGNGRVCLVWPITLTVVDNKVLFIFSLFNNLVFSFVCFHFFVTFEGGVIFIDNNNNKFHIKTFRLVSLLFLFLFA